MNNNDTINCRTVFRAMASAMALIITSTLGESYLLTATAAEEASAPWTEGAVRENFTFCQDFVIPERMDPEVAADYLEIVEERINQYGMEHMTEYPGSFYGFKSGLSGGHLADLNQDGIPEMILVYRDSGGSYQEQTETGYEIWTWEDGSTFEMFFGELERIHPEGENESAEFLNIWLGTSGTYLEMGYAPNMYQDIDPETDATERWFMTYDMDGEFYRMPANPANEDLILRIPVAAGNQIHLANCYAFLDYLAEKASDIAKTDPAAALEAITYYGDPEKCQMSGHMAVAYAMDLLSEPLSNPETTETSFLQAMLVDVDGGVPFMIKTVPHIVSPVPYMYSDALKNGASHFIDDAMFCYYDEGAVKEYSFLNDAKNMNISRDNPPLIQVGYLDNEAREAGAGILVAMILNLQEGTSETLFYFAKNGKPELFHRLTTNIYDHNSTYWDGVLTQNPDGNLYNAGLENWQTATWFYVINSADQTAASYTTATTTARMLMAYAPTQEWERPEPGRDYSNWASRKGTIRSVELAYLCAFTNNACTEPTTGKMRDYMFEALKNFPQDHPLHTDDDSSRSNLKKSQITAIRSGTNGSMEAIIIKLSEERMIVIFGGTMGTELDDILTDMGIVGNTIPVLGNLGSILSAINPVTWFAEDQFEAAARLISDLENKGCHTIFVAGHSLGGHIAVDVALNHDGIVECMAFDPPGRSDTAFQKAFNNNAVWKIITYKAIGSIVSMVGTQLGSQVKDLPVEDNMDAAPFPNHDIFKIAEALGGWDAVREK